MGKAAKQTTHRPSRKQQRLQQEMQSRAEGNVVSLISVGDAVNDDRKTSVRLTCKSKAQKNYLATIRSNALTVGTGPAGTGKTYVCTAYAAEELREKRVKKIIVTRPAEAADDGIGYLPGDVMEKFAPYFEPFKRVLVQYFGETHLEYLIKKGIVEIAPIGFLRGLTFEDAVVLLDEAQNATPKQMKLFLTRIGENTKVIVNGDTDQKDIKGKSGLDDILGRLSDCPDVGFFEFTEDDIVRSGLVKNILKCYRNP